MKILEITPELRPRLPGSNSQQMILEEIEASVIEAERFLPENSSTLDKLCSTIQKNFSRLNSVSSPLSNSEKLQIWKLSYRLWNACVDLSNARSSTFNVEKKIDEQQANLRQISAELLFLAGEVTGIPSPSLKTASFFYKTGLIWHDLKKFDFAASCFERATDLSTTAKKKIIDVDDDDDISNTEEGKFLLDLNLARSRTAWELSERNLALTLLNRCKNILFGSPENYREVANQYLIFGRLILSNNNLESAIKESLKLMNEALDLCDKGLTIVRRSDEFLPLKTLRSKSLRFIAAVHLQGGEFESVLKCIKVLREGGGDQHPTSPVLAMNAWLGLGRYREAEKELRGMFVNKEIPEGIWLSAIEAYFQAAGVAGAETVKGVFLGLLGRRCHVSAGMALRVVHKLISSGGGGRDGSLARAKVVAELVSDDRVMALFNSEEEEKKLMHAILWNCGADHFRLKNYETSAEIFEKSMLYIPYNNNNNNIEEENIMLRAKGNRVLCLCHLGLSQLDQAQEYIDEAVKLEPFNVACAFIKFKVYLQKKDENGAIKQMESMATTCHDFTPEFLSLSAHEAFACEAFPVAVESLTNLLNLYSNGNKPMSTPPEVVVLRTLITILSRVEPTNEKEILKFTKQAKKRMMSEIGGPESFFGKGEVGRREKNWYAVNSWNYGTRTGKEKKYELCAEFYESAAEFYGASIDGGTVVEEAESIMVCNSLILSVSATIVAEKSRNSPLPESDVKRAIELLDRAEKIVTEKSSAIEPWMFFTYALNVYDLRGRLENGGAQQLQLVKSFASLKACKPEYLLQIGLIASHSPRPNPEAANFALNACLSSLLASPSPDYKTIALIIRKLIMLAGFYKDDTDDEVYSMYKQAYRIMVGLKEGEYPREEGKWLATTAWNRAGMPVRLGQISVAKRWINIGLELGRHVKGMEGCMEEFVAAFHEKFCGGHVEKDVGDGNSSTTSQLVL